jgi:hypothetical protein
MLDKLTIDTFANRIGESFTICPNDTVRIPTTLSEVTDLTALAGKHGANRPRVPFSLLFHIPSNLVLPQQIYRIEHDELEPMEIFLVPLGPDQRGMSYEAVFS